MIHDDQDLKVNRTPTTLDLYSGAGGTGLGFLRAGFHIVGAVELDENAAETYEQNLKVKVKRINIRKLTPRTFREELNLEPENLDVLVGCPPCQGFSRMRNAAGANDEDNELVLLYLDFVTEFRPRFAVFENVPGLIRSEHGRKFFGDLCEGFRKLGYRLVKHEVDAADYGTPQHRRRVIVVAGRDGEVPPFPDPTHTRPGTLELWNGTRNPWRTVRDTIGNGKYPTLKAGENGEQGSRYPNHIAPPTGEDVLAFIKQVPKDGGSRSEVPRNFWLQCHLDHDGHKDVYGRLAWDEPANTITSGCTNPSKGRFVHPDQDRALTFREAAALQGFPDDFVFYGYRVATQIGNAVPPPLAQAIAGALKERLLLEPLKGNTDIPPAKDILHTVAGPVDKSNVRSPAHARAPDLPDLGKAAARAPEDLPTLSSGAS